MGSPQLGESCWPEFRRLETLRPWLSTGGTLLAVSDHFASMAAAYYLRDMPVRVGLARMYMDIPVVHALVERSAMPPTDRLQYVVTDGSARPDASSPGSVEPEPLLREHGVAVWKLRSDWRVLLLGLDRPPVEPSRVVMVVASRATGAVRLRGNVVLGAPGPA